ncbi:MAG: hypothetical protein ACREOI_16340, partial [bacterium]
MNEELKSVYRELGYIGPLPGDEEEPRGRGDESYELPPLDEPGLAQLEQLLRDQPAELVAFFRKKYNYPLTEKKIRSTIAEAREAFDDPAAFFEKLRAWRQKPSGKGRRGPNGKVPPELIQFPEIEIEPGNHRFEPKAD